MKALAVSVLDLLFAIGLLVVAGIAITGGGIVEFWGQRVSLRTAGNGLTALAMLGSLRLLVGGNDRFLGTGLTPERLGRHTAHFFSSLRQSSDRTVFWILVLGTVFGLVVRLLNAWFHPGFFSGDDVEIHEMTMSTLAGAPWAAWDLRSAFYPLAFIFPIQFVTSWLGGTDPGTLVFIGRAVVAVLSSAIIPLVFVVGRAMAGVPVALVASLFTATSALLTVFGSTELPRPVAAVLVLTGFYLAHRREPTSSAISGLALGIAAAMRFSEIMFALPLLLQLGVERRFRDGVLAAGSLALTFVSIQMVSDFLYWGSPFASAQAVVEYTLVQGLSSRGYQPWWHYLAHATDWTTYVVFGLAAFGMTSRTWRWGLWAFVPLILLSALPHKESRYLIPVYPFVALLAAAGLWRSLTAIQMFRRKNVWLAILGALVAGSLIHQISGMHVRRSDSAVEMARWLRHNTDPSGTLLVEQGWRLGGRIYLGFDVELVDVDATHLVVPGRLAELIAQKRVSRAVISHETCAAIRCDHVLPALGFTWIDASVVQRGGYVAFSRSPRAGER